MQCRNHMADNFHEKTLNLPELSLKNRGNEEKSYTNDLKMIKLELKLISV